MRLQKFGSLVHRFGMISVGSFFGNILKNPLDPQNRGYFEGGAGISEKILPSVLPGVILTFLAIADATR